MIEFNRFELDNGLKVIVHEDASTPMVVVNVMYNVGAKDEDPEKTGFAHLFEHLMFGGSINIESYDEPLQMAGGENNAYTTNDLTNYYCQLPAENIETAFWLESDRMLSLAFSKKSLEVQRKVVCEEFKEHYINKPYGDIWLKMRSLAYSRHPYRWMTIGKELSHIENAKLSDVKSFFYKYYRPNNAILVVAGNTTTAQVKHLAEKWFGDIAPGEIPLRNIEAEPEQKEKRQLQIEAGVPLDAILKAWHMPNRMHKGYYVCDLITDILGGGGSSRLYQKLVKEKKLFSSIDCYHFGTIDPGLLAIDGKLIRGVSFTEAEAEIDAVLNELIETKITEAELQKVKNRSESTIAFEDMSIINRANSLAYYELLGDAGLMNGELKRYEEVTVEEIQRYAADVFRETNSNLIQYCSKNQL